MDLSSKKRKVDENGAAVVSLSATLTPEDLRKVIESFSQEQLIDIVAGVMCRDEGTLDAVREIADRDPVQRKLFIRGLGWETNTEKLRSVFSDYGELTEAVVISDKATGKSKGYGFITFRHIDGALLALKEPNKKIDGRTTITQLAASGPAGSTVSVPPTADVSLRKIYVGNVPTSDVSLRKIYVGNVPADTPSERLRALFRSYGELEEGPLGFDKQLGKFKGYALFIYKTVEAAQAALVDPIKSIDGSTLQCKLATDGKKGRSGAVVPGAGVPGKQLGGIGADGHGDGLGMGSQSSMPGSFSSQFGGPGGGLSSYGGFSGSVGFPVVGAGIVPNHHLNSPLQSSIGLGNVSLPSAGGQALSLGGSGVGGYVGGGMSGGTFGSLQYPGAGGYGGLGMGSSSLYRTPASSVGLPASGFPEGGPYSSSMYQGQHHQPAGSSPGPRFPPGGGMYQNVPHYF